MSDFILTAMLAFLLAISAGFINPSTVIEYRTNTGELQTYRVGVQEGTIYVRHLAK